MSIKCPRCGAVAGSSPEPLAEGAFRWSCPECHSDWEIRTAFFKERGGAYNNEAFVHLVRKAMKAQGMTQKALADLVGVTGAYIALITSSQRVPTLSVARRILEALGEHEAAEAL